MSVKLRMEATTYPSLGINAASTNGGARTIYTGFDPPSALTGYNGDLYISKDCLYQKITNVWTPFLYGNQNIPIPPTQHVRFQLDTTNASAGSMQLIILSQPPADLVEAQISFNGVQLTYNADYSIVNGIVTATPELNVSYGGIGNDGYGFSSDDLVSAYYEY